jgi:two-component system response regulator HydG
MAEVRIGRLTDLGAGGGSPLLLVVDDEAPIREFLSDYAEFTGFRVTACASGREALAVLDRETVDLALVDLRMPQIDGMEVIKAIRQKAPQCQVVLMSGVGSISTAVEAIKLGARDYLEKPFDPDTLQKLLDGVRAEFESRRAQGPPHRGPAAPAPAAAPPEAAAELFGMVGGSRVMQELFGLVRKVAPQVKTALIIGETGTGKELVARALHRLSPRHAANFVTVGCAGLAEAFGESELFGHQRGAFAGATDDRSGAFEDADGGVLFLDEISELPLSLQGRLLRVLEDGEVARLGSHAPKKIDVMILAATSHDLRTEMLAGRVRPDLYYRLSNVTLHVPPLRARKEDIPGLAASFVREFGQRMGRPLRGLTPEAEERLQRGEWRGNVRALRNAVERACMLADGEFVTDRHLAQASEMSRPPGPGR